MATFTGYGGVAEDEEDESEEESEDEAVDDDENADENEVETNFKKLNVSDG